MKISVKIEPSTSSGSFIFDPAEYGYSNEAWAELTESEKNEVIQEAADETDQIYPVVASWKEI